jgi:hypothetical protein
MMNLKLRFSDCGRYLHIVILEGQRRWQSSGSTSFLGQLPDRIRVDAGKRFALSASKIPFTVTWRSQDVYVSCSSYQLSVFRISLFKGGSRKCRQDMIACPMTTLQKPPLLPGTALQRPVYYIPPSADNKPAALGLLSAASSS